MPMVSSLISSSATKSLFPSSFISCHVTLKFHSGSSTWGMIPQWTGLKHLVISISPKSLKSSRFERKGRCKGKVVRASLFGVGAPEALVIGVVALLVFGPKGLAEVARNLGKTLRAFQPTIKELQEVSREFKSTLEREIGFDDLPNQTQNRFSSNNTYTGSNSLSIGGAENSSTVADLDGASSPNNAYMTEEYLKITEEQLKAFAAQQQGQSPPPGQSKFEPQTQPQPQASVKETAGKFPPPEMPESEV